MPRAVRLLWRSDGSDRHRHGLGVSGNALGKQMSNQLNSGFDVHIKSTWSDAAAQQQAAQPPRFQGRQRGR